jgi:hypothetical protein
VKTGCARKGSPIRRITLRSKFEASRRWLLDQTAQCQLRNPSHIVVGNTTAQLQHHRDTFEKLVATTVI